VVKPRQALWKKLSKLNLARTLVFKSRLVFFGLCLTLAGCPNAVEFDSAFYLNDYQSVAPLLKDKTVYRYLLDGTQVEASYRLSQQENQFTLELIAHGKVLEKEVYEIRDESVLLIESLGEVYDRPIPLMRFPFRAGDAYTWEGKMKSEEGELECTAKVTSSEDQVMRKDRAERAIQVDVALAIRQNDFTLDKKLSFWIVPEEGILKRRFGVSVRTVEE
jgi:hypothetical protein